MSFGTVLVTGGCGVLGHHVVQQLVDQKLCQSITVISRNPTDNLIKGVTYLPCDITSAASVRAIFSKVVPSTVFHVAASLSTKSATNNFAAMQRINIQGTRNLLEASQQSGTVKAFIYTSSPSVIHNGQRTNPLVMGDESLPVITKPEQTIDYAHTKAIAETIVLAANGDKGVLTVSIRPSGLFGEGDTLMTKAQIERARAGKAKVQIGNLNNNLFDLTYLGDAAAAHLLAAKKLYTTPLPSGPLRVDGEAFNITAGDPRPFWPVVRMWAAAAGCPVRPEEIKTMPIWLALLFAGLMEWVYWLGTMGRSQPVVNRQSIGFTVMQRTFSIDKARKRLGYEPRVGLEEGMRRGVEWYDGKYGKTTTTGSGNGSGKLEGKWKEVALEETSSGQ